MKKILIIIVAVVAGWLAWNALKSGEKPDNDAVKYAGRLSESIEKAESAKDTANLAVVRSAVTMFRSKEGRYPKSLNELVEKGYMHTAPSGISYDHETGKVK